MSSQAMSLKGRLKNHAKQKNVSAQVLLQNYMFERMLERLARSKYKDKFILKGGMLVAAMVGIDNRATMDIDTTIRAMSVDEENLRKVLEEICRIPIEDDVTINLLKMAPIRKDDEYGGIRASLEAVYDTIKTPFTIDITTGDVITPEAVKYRFTGMFDEGVSFELWAYSLETVLAEKVETIMRRGPLSTRPRDFYDIYILYKTQQYDAEMFKKAFWATAEHRSSTEQLQNMMETLRTVSGSKELQKMWVQYRKAYSYAAEITYEHVMEVLKIFLSQVIS